MRTLFAFLIGLFPFALFSQKATTPLTAQQILRMVAQRYDPDERWDQYRGEMHLYTIRPNGGSTEEDLILDNARSFYQSTLFSNGNIIVRKLDLGAPFFSVNGRTEPTNEEIVAFQLDENGLKQTHQHHQIHFGLPMYLLKIKLPLAPVAKRAHFNDIDCWVLTFPGDPAGAYGDYFRSPIQVYVNPDDYALVGMRYDSREGALPPAYVVFSEEIEVGGVRLPKIKTYYRSADDSYWFTDVFYPFTRQTYAAEEAEKEAIRRLLDDETRYFYARDYENWAKCWSQQEDVFFSFSSRTDYVIKKGWNELQAHMRNYMRENPDPHLPPIERSEYVFHLQGALAWVYFKNKEGEQTAGLHQRVLRKENGVWKMVNMTGIDEASYQE